MTVTSYDPKKVNLVVEGEFMVGYHDGTFISTGRNADSATPHVGAHGDVTYSESADNTGFITFTLKADSASLETLQTLAKSRDLIQAQVIDANTNNFQAGGTECRILMVPGREYNTEISGVEIRIHVADYSTN